VAVRLVLVCGLCGLVIGAALALNAWWGRLPTVAQSFAYAKANPLGVALLPAVVLLSLVLMALAGRLALRELRR